MCLNALIYVWVSLLGNKKMLMVYIIIINESMNWKHLQRNLNTDTHVGINSEVYYTVFYELSILVTRYYRQ